MFADDVIAAPVNREGRPQDLDATLAIKTVAVAASAQWNNHPDDVKSAAEDIYVGLTRLLGLRYAGNDVDAFMHDTLAPLVTPPLPTFERMKASVLDRLL